MVKNGNINNMAYISSIIAKIFGMTIKALTNFGCFKGSIFMVILPGTSHYFINKWIFTWASTQIPNSVMVPRILPIAYPTKFVVTLIAGHMVAPIRFLNRSFAFWT